MSESEVTAGDYKKWSARKMADAELIENQSKNTIGDNEISSVLKLLKTDIIGRFDHITDLPVSLDVTSTTADSNFLAEDSAAELKFQYKKSFSPRDFLLVQVEAIHACHLLELTLGNRNPSVAEAYPFGELDQAALRSFFNTILKPIVEKLTIENENTDDELENELGVKYFNFLINLAAENFEIAFNLIITETLVEKLIYLNNNKKTIESVRNIQPKDMKICLTTSMVNTTVDLDHILSLSEGDLIEVKSRSTVTMFAGNVNLLEGILGVADKKRVVKLTKNKTKREL